ncbi:MAG: transglutaminase family protein [Sphingomicrobium sp.]
MPRHCQMRLKVLSRIASLALLFVTPPAFAGMAAKEQPQVAVAESLRSSDFLSTKVALDHIINPSIRSANVVKEVAALTAAARTFAGPHPSVGAQFDAVRKVLYQSGPWNDNRPFTYDHSDPLGENVRHKLLSEYLKTRLGNCVTMPILFMIVGRGVGLHLTLTDAPLHLLVRYTHPGLPTLNVEATSGGRFARDELVSAEPPNERPGD